MTELGRHIFRLCSESDGGASVTLSDDPDLTMAKRLVDDLKGRGFEFVRTAPGPDGPPLGRRATGQWLDTIYIEGFSDDCMAWRQRRSLLIVPGLGATGRRET